MKRFINSVLYTLAVFSIFSLLSAYTPKRYHLVMAQQTLQNESTETVSETDTLSGSSSSSASVSEPSLSSNTLMANDIRGWVYVYENIHAQNNANRRALKQGDAIPTGQDVLVSPNSRVTLKLGESVEFGINGNTHFRIDSILQSRSTQEINMRLEKGSAWLKLNGSALGNRNMLVRVNLIRTVLKENITLYFQSGTKSGAVDITYVEGSETISFWRPSNERYFLTPGQFMPVSPDTTQPNISDSVNLHIIKPTINAWYDWKPEPLALDLDFFIPPLELYPPYGTVPALHPYLIPVDHTMLLPPETRSMGEIIALYKKALELFKRDTGNYPTRDQGLKVLSVPDRTQGWKGPYVPLSLPRRDVWGSEYVYELIQDKGKTYPDVRSMGPNQKDDKGLEDDIR